MLEVTLITGTRNYQTAVDRWSQELLCGRNVERTDRQTDTDQLSVSPIIFGCKDVLPVTVDDREYLA